MNESDIRDTQRFKNVVDFIGPEGIKNTQMPGSLITEKMARDAIEKFEEIKSAAVEAADYAAHEFLQLIGFRSGAFRSTKITLVNRSPFYLVKMGEDVCHGIWMTGKEPPTVIGPGKVVLWGSESEGAGTGTEGAVQYRICGEFEGYGRQDLGLSFKIHWSNPALGSNKSWREWPDGDENNPYWERVGMEFPSDSSLKGDNNEIVWGFRYT